MASASSWPVWWTWELELTPHLERRMEDRDFNEIDVRTMPQDATSYRNDWMEGRFVVETTHRQQTWQVIVEPDELDELLVVVTAYPKQQLP